MRKGSVIDVFVGGVAVEVGKKVLDDVEILKEAHKVEEKKKLLLLRKERVR